MRWPISAFRCVIAPSFGDIFAANAVNNGLLPAPVRRPAAEEMIGALKHGAEAVTIDLNEAEIRTGNRTFRIRIDPAWRTKLLNGWNDLDLTCQLSRDIAGFVAADARLRPWAPPPPDLPSRGN